MTTALELIGFQITHSKDPKSDKTLKSLVTDVLHAQINEMPIAQKGTQKEKATPGVPVSATKRETVRITVGTTKMASANKEKDVNIPTCERIGR